MNRTCPSCGKRGWNKPLKWCSYLKHHIAYEKHKASVGSPRSKLRIRLSLYGLTRIQYEAILKAQGDTCAICKTAKWETGKGGVPQVDHNHLTGQVRGLLCGECNRGLKVLENLEFVSKAQGYLRRYEYA